MKSGTNAANLIMDDREEGIFRVHRSVFTDKDIFEAERRLVFDKSWLFAGHISEFPKAGNFVSRNVGGRPVILVNSDDGKIRALLNTCRHRGNLVCREHKGTAEVFRCFYHGWIFNTRGELKGIPGEAAYSDAFDRDALGLEPVPRMHNHRGCIFVSYDPDIESFEDFMGEALAVFDNTLNQGEMEFLEGHFEYSMRANWKLLVENSMDGYHAAHTHERFFANFMPDMGMKFGHKEALDLPTGNVTPLGNGHVTQSYPGARGRHPNYEFRAKFAADELKAYEELLTKRHGPEKAAMIENGAGNYLIFPNLIVIDGWNVFRTFYPVSPDYMEITGWAAMPKEDGPQLRKTRLDWYLGFQGPGGFSTPDDVEALEGCQLGFATQKEVEWSDISRSMKGNQKGGPSELQMRVFWREWAARMSGSPHAAEYAD